MNIDDALPCPFCGGENIELIPANNVTYDYNSYRPYDFILL